MLKSYIENGKNLIFTHPDGLRQEQPLGLFALSLLRADWDGLLQYIDDILTACDREPEAVPPGADITDYIAKKLEEAHPLISYFYPLNETTLRRCFHKRLRALCTRRPALLSREEYRTIHDRIPFALNHAYLEEYFCKLQYAHIRKYYAEHVDHDPKLAQQLQTEITYLTEKTRSLDKFLSEHPDFPEDLPAYIKTVADRLRERLRAIFDVEYQPVNTLPVEKRYFLENLLHGKQSVFMFDNYSISYSIAVTGRIAEKFKQAQSAEDYVRILKECPLNHVEELPVYHFEEALEIEVRGMLQMGARLKCCRNCGHYFLPASRVDEIYCGEPYQDGKTCRQVGYDIKQNTDELLKAYRTAYKTQHAKMQRNRNKPAYREQVFLPWVKDAKQQLERAQHGELTEDAFREWLISRRSGPSMP